MMKMTPTLIPPCVCFLNELASKKAVKNILGVDAGEESEFVYPIMSQGNMHVSMRKHATCGTQICRTTPLKMNVLQASEARMMMRGVNMLKLKFANKILTRTESLAN